MRCPAKKLGANPAVGGGAILVAQAILPVPQVAASRVRCKEAKECVGLILLCGACVMMGRSGTACRAPTEETVTAKRTMSCGCQAFAIRGMALRWHRQECLCY